MTDPVIEPAIEHAEAPTATTTHAVTETPTENGSDLTTNGAGT